MNRNQSFSGRSLIRFLAFLPLSLSAFLSAYAAPLPTGAFTIQDRGQSRTFEIATNEIHLITRARHHELRAIAPLADPEAVRQHADSLRKSTGEETDLVLYEAGKPRNEFTRRILTRRVLVKLEPGRDAEQLARTAGASTHSKADGAPDYFIFETPETGGALTLAEQLAAQPGVLSAEPLLARQQQKKFIPNDTLFANQWHLRNTGQGGGTAGMDVNITNVWDNYKGDGIRIGIVDDGLQHTHPDLQPNYDSTTSTNFNDATADPSPNVANEDFHGTSCAGIAAARGNNALGVCGAAFQATLAGLRLIGAATTDTDEASAMGYKNDLIHIKSNSWGPNDDGATLEGPGPLTLAAMANAVQNGRGGKGTIFVWAAGNGLASNDNANYDGYANSIYTIAVSAVSDQGNQADYSEPGACIVVASPSSSSGRQGTTTVDLVGNDGYNATGVTGELSDRSYTQTFGGTSSATPLASGVIALMLQANANLGWRDVQEILIRTATKSSAGDPDWTTNAAGFHFNHKYGAGLINAAAAVNLGSTWTNLPAQTNVTSLQTNLSVTIPDNNTTGVTRSFDLSTNNLRVEQVTVTASINHTYRGDLAITLTSPNGTQSRLAEKHSDSGNNYTNWVFSSVRHWGENSQGTWTVKITDLAASDTGTLTSLRLTVYGTPGTPVNQPPVISSATILPGTEAFSDEPLSVTNIIATDAESDTISFSYQWQFTSNNVTFIDLPGATNTTLASAVSGMIWHCRITPRDTNSTGAPFFSGAVTVNNRPNQLTAHGQSYSYDSDLFLVANASTFNRAAILNEFSQGIGQNKEWVEILTLKNSDMRGWRLRDTTGPGVTFSSNVLWSNVPAGTLVVVYNGADRDTTLPADDSNASDGTLVVSSSSATYFSGSWGALGNSGDSIILSNANATIVDALSYSSAAVFDPKLAAVGSAKSAQYAGDTESGADDVAQWEIVASSAGVVTPAAGNNSTNSQFVTNLRSDFFSQIPLFRFATNSDLVPGLSIDTTNGIISGIVNSPTGGLFNIVIERYTTSQVVTQRFTLVVADTNGIVTIPPGKIWVLNNNYTIAGSLVVNGALDTAGYTLIVSNTLNVSTGSVTNETGSILYGQLTGGPLPGASQQLLSPYGDADGDGMLNWQELFAGTNPNDDASALRILSVLPTTTNTLINFSSVSGKSYRVERRDDLNVPGWTTVTNNLPATGAQTEAVDSEANQEQRYYRVEVLP